MSNIKLTHAGGLRPGSYLLIEGEPYIVKDTQTSRPGKHGHAKVRIKAAHIITGSNKEVVKPGHDDVEVPIINKVQAQVLSVTGEDVEMMDMESFENVLADLKNTDVEIKEKIKAGQTVLVWKVMNKVIIKDIVEEA